MGIERLTPDKEIKEYLIRGIDKFNIEIIQTLKYVGEKVVNEARDQGSYLNQTGNLRSSIGCGIVKDGRLISTFGFQQVKDGKEGIDTGKSYLKELISKNPKGLVLIVVAGRNYAAYVEARGLNVLNSSELLAQRLVPRMLKKLGLQ